MNPKKATTHSKPSYLKKIDDFFTSKIWIIFIAILLIGLYLRFYQIEAAISFGWDQSRDAWEIRNILHGGFTLIGPRTGVGHMHLGPVYYYLLAPFYYLTNFDPMGSNYFNILSNIFNFVVLFVVTRKIFGNYAAAFVVLIYSVNHYLILLSQIPWNVTLMTGFAVLIFYSIVQIYNEKYKWVFILWALSGFYFNLHFTAVFIPIINILSLLFVKNKKKVIYYSLLSLPLYFIWFVPVIIYGLQTGGGDSNLLKNFFRDYYIGFHFRFFLHRASDAFIQFDRLLYNPFLKYLTFILPAVFAVLIALEKDKRKRLLGYLIALWFIVPWVGFSLYGGPLSEYYFLYNAPMVLFVMFYIQQKLAKLQPALFLMLFTLFWSYYIFQNTKDLWVKPTYGGLYRAKR
jgi:4-amino-4-deoxy-L-arabinose transferase-like glycosyltransferase